MKTKISVVVIACLLAAGCATLFKGNTSRLDLSSEPGGAEVYVNGRYMGDTPCTLKLESKRSYSVEFRKKGFQTKTVNVTNHIGAGWIILDVIAGLAPVIVDAATGAWYELDQKNINVLLEKYLVPLE